MRRLYSDLYNMKNSILDSDFHDLVQPDFQGGGRNGRRHHVRRRYRPSYSRLCERVSELADELKSNGRFKRSVLLAQSCDNVSDRVLGVGIDSTEIKLSDTTL